MSERPNSLFPPCIYSVFVIAHDGGCEGWSAPVQAFLTLDEAKAAYGLMSQTTSFGVFEVPVWPHIARQGKFPEPWFNIEPVWPEKAKLDGSIDALLDANFTAGGTGGAP